MKLKLHPLFCEGMVLQRGLPVRIYGEITQPGTVEAELDGAAVRGEFAAGPFCLTLPAREAGRGLRLTVRFQDEAGELRDVLCGEVWVTGGQSNMAMWLRDTRELLDGGTPEACDDVRFYSIGRNLFATPGEFPAGCEWAYNADTPWQACGGPHTPFFSAVGYYFALALQKRLGVPGGVIACRVGGASLFAGRPRAPIVACPATAHICA